MGNPRSDWGKVCMIGLRTTWKKSGWSSSKARGTVAVWSVLFIGLILLRLRGESGAERLEQELTWAIQFGLATVGTFVLVLLYNIWRAPMQMMLSQRKRWRDELGSRAAANKALVIELADLKGKPSVGRVQSILNDLIVWGWMIERDIDGDVLFNPDSAITRFVWATDAVLMSLIVDRFIAEHFDALRGLSNTDKDHLVKRMTLLRRLSDNLDPSQVKKYPMYDEAQDYVNAFMKIGDVPIQIDPSVKPASSPSPSGEAPPDDAPTSKPG